MQSPDPSTPRCIQIHPNDNVAIVDVDKALLPQNDRTSNAIVSRPRVTPDVDADGTVCGWFGMHRDITEERSARTRIAESEERFRTLTEWSPEAILVHRDGTVIYANPAAATLLRARSAEQIIGATFIDLIVPG
ncbi:MAG: PAS domain-containing protein, partial [Verrucomicrobiota bacterium]